MQDLKERLQWISLCSFARDYPCDSFNVSKASWSHTLNPACGIVAHLHVISFMWACVTCFSQDICCPAHLVSLSGHTEAALIPQGVVGGYQGGLEDVNSWSIYFAFLFVSIFILLRMFNPIFLGAFFGFFFFSAKATICNLAEIWPLVAFKLRWKIGPQNC